MFKCQRAGSRSPKLHVGALYIIFGDGTHIATIPEVIGRTYHIMQALKISQYGLVIWHSHGIWQFIVNCPINNGDVP